jgi:glycolate oxidase iron-sulfur subunit
MLENLKSVEDDIVKCVRCGACRHTCPTFRGSNEETKLCRGRVILSYAVEKGQIPLSKKFAELIYLCQNCDTCTVTCPTGTPATKIVLAARRDCFETLDKKELVKLIYNSSGDASAKKLWANVISNNLPKNNIWHTVIPNSFEKLPEPRFEMHHVNSPKANVLLYIDETTAYIYPNIAQKAIDILSSMGVQVHIPKTICSSGAFFMIVGDFKTAKFIASKNLEQIEQLKNKYDVIITLDGVSTWMLSRGYKELFGDAGFASKNVESMNVESIVSYIYKIGGDRELNKNNILNMKVVVISSGALKNRLNITDDTTNLLRKMSANVANLGLEDRVFGDEFGILPITNWQMIEDVASVLKRAIADIKPDIVVTFSPQLKMQLSKILDVPVKHPIELL